MDGEFFTVTFVDPLRSAAVEVQVASITDVMVYVDVVAGLTTILKLPLPFPFAVEPSLKVIVHAPFAVTFPLMVVFAG